ncbi:hypothetical protein I7I50_09012 [Histoplasma capsulatum G186AR]|uniref:Uncharacterized protein n=1 Tax=Ajellomyces capsulatus TaxID=5037 RepID=A0A8H7YRQ1_AJECA|nr:hypothetical protein I7I52_06527 [Histoplasma capsulatum]QSS74029.1 hypothetical protein I7I50_09012 [Histoplasma capsulatum G186AR]
MSCSMDSNPQIETLVKTRYETLSNTLRNRNPSSPASMITNRRYARTLRLASGLSTTEHANLTLQLQVFWHLIQEQKVNCLEKRGELER